MPMGVVSDEEFERQVANTTNSLSIPPQDDTTQEHGIPPAKWDSVDLVVDQPIRGRKEGDNNVPSSLRSLIAGTHAIEGRPAALELAREFGISPSSVSAYAKGATSTKSYDKPKEDILQFIKQRRAKVTKKALRVMTQSLDHITDEALANTKPEDLSKIAKDMSAIIGHMSENNQNNVGNQVNFVLFAPPVKSEDSFDIIPSHIE